MVLLVLLVSSTALANVEGGADGAVTEAQALLAKQKWAEAAIVLKRMLRQSPDAATIANDLSRALVYSGRREEALTTLTTQAGRARGVSRAGFIRRARVISRLFLTNETFEAYQEGLNLLKNRRYNAAADRLEKALDREPDNVEILLRLGQCLVLEGDFDSAAERLRVARRLNSYEPQVRLWLGRALHQRGEIAEAVEELRAALAELDGSELAPVWLAEALGSAGQRGAALRLLQEDVRAKPLHLVSLLTSARLSFSAASGKDKSGLWAARKDLQLVLSRASQYDSAPVFEGELGLSVRSSRKLLEDAQTLMTAIDSRLQSGNSEG